MDSSMDWSDGRSPKKARFEEQPESPAPPSDTYDDTEDLYDETSTKIDPVPSPNAVQNKPTSSVDPLSQQSSKSLPGLGLLQVVSPINKPSTLSPSVPPDTPNIHTEKEAEGVQNKEGDNTVSQSVQNGVDTEVEATVDDAKAALEDDGLRPPLDSSVSRPLDVPSAIDKNEFLEAAKNNRGDAEAEWQYDSSDADSDSSSLSSDSSDESEAGDYELLGPEEQARMLMAEEGGSDDEGKKRGKDAPHAQPRTQNELPEIKIERPDITVTPEMEVCELGTASMIVENHLLITGTVSGTTQVLESGSLLCLSNRTVIGVVAEPLGRVDSPLYSVAFTNSAESEELGVEIGAKIFYVKDHSSYVFTKPLRLVKGSDASNIHDEEVGDDEVEFSDDEAEAEYKRKKKLDKLARKGPFEKSEIGESRDRRLSMAQPSPNGYPDAAIRYDEDDNDGLYTPLARPTGPYNISPASMPPPPQRRPDRGRGGRGRGERDHGRGRGRGRGRGNFDARPPQDHQSSVAAPSNGAGTATTNQGQQMFPQTYNTQNSQTPQQSGTLQGNFNAWNPPAGGFPAPSMPSPHILPPGSFVNPAFFRGQQQQQQQAQNAPNLSYLLQQYSGQLPPQNHRSG